MEPRQGFGTGILVGLAIGLLLGVGIMVLFDSSTTTLDPIDENPRVGDARDDDRREPREDGVGGTSSRDRAFGGAREIAEDTTDDAETDEDASVASEETDDDETEDADLAARIERLEWSLKGKADDAGVIREYVDAMTEAGTPGLAVEFLEKLLAEDPENVEVMVGIGLAATQESGRLSREGPAGMMAAGKFAFRARELFGQAIELNGEHETARFHRALLGVYAPKFLKWDADAETDLKKLIENQKGRATETGAEPYVHLGELYRRSGRLEEAKKVLEEGAARYPNSEGLRAKLEAVK